MYNPNFASIVHGKSAKNVFESNPQKKSKKKEEELDAHQIDSFRSARQAKNVIQI